MSDSNIIYKARLHWILFLWPTVFALFAIFIGMKISPLREVSFVLLLIAVAWIVMTWVTFHFSSLTIKKKQVILRMGMLVRQTIDMPMTKIETIDIRQSILGSIFRYGTLVITGTGGTRHLINYLNKPLTCRRYIEQLMHE